MQQKCSKDAVKMQWKSSKMKRILICPYFSQSQHYKHEKSLLKMTFDKHLTFSKKPNETKFIFQSTVLVYTTSCAGNDDENVLLKGNKKQSLFWGDFEWKSWKIFWALVHEIPSEKSRPDKKRCNNTLFSQMVDLWHCNVGNLSAFS